MALGSAEKIKFHCIIYKCKNQVGYRDDTVPKTGDTRRVELTVCNNLPPTPLPTSHFLGVAEDCCILSTLPHSAFLTSYFIFNDFYTCITSFP